MRTAAGRRLFTERHGRSAERKALLWLLLKGYRPLARRYSAAGGEIDLVMRRGGTIAFVEVKARSSMEAALTAIDASKRRRFSRAVRAWLARHPQVADLTFRADAVFLSPGISKPPSSSISAAEAGTSCDDPEFPIPMADFSIRVVPVTPFQQNCSLAWSAATKRGVVVDPGGDLPLIQGAIAEAGITVETILLTHGHIDHAGGAAALRDALGVPIVGPHEADRPLLERLEAQGRQYGLDDARNVSPDRFLAEGESLDIAGTSFDVLHCPGHSPGSVVLFAPTLRFAFMGDVLFAGSVGRTDLPGGSHESLIRAIKEKVLPLGDDVSFLPGHGPGSTLGEERATNPFLR